MSLQVDMDKWDYQEAVKAVQKLLNNIDYSLSGDFEGEPKVRLDSMPSAEEIVDLVWDKIK